LAAYSQRDGAIGRPPEAQSVGIDVSAHPYTLVMAVHPKCPCTRATLFELERLLAKCRADLGVQIYVYRPPDESPDWAGDDRLGLERRFGATRVLVDGGGSVAARLGCLTSGSVVLYGADGVARYWGGITTGRGHAGDNVGSDAILTVVRGDTPAIASAPVFGCPITAGHSVTPAACCEGTGNE